MNKVIKFYANWCGPCKVYAKTFDKVVEKYEGQVDFVSINVDEDTEGLAATHNVRSIPHTVLVKEDGTVIPKTGNLSSVELEELVIS